MQENGLNWHFLTGPVFCYFSKCLVQNCLNICFESLRYVVYETKVKKIWHCICSDLRKVKVKVTLEKDNTKLAFFAHVIVDLTII